MLPLRQLPRRALWLRPSVLSSRRLKDPSCVPVYKDAIFHGTRTCGEAGRRSQLFVIVADRSSRGHRIPQTDC